MLYNPEWTKLDPLSLPALIAWLEKQPAAATYCYSDTGHCLAAQYCKHVGIGYSVIPLGWYEACNRTNEFLYQLENISCPFTGERTTFGAALTRAKALLAETVTQ